MQDGIENEGEKLIRSPTLRISQEDEVRVLLGTFVRHRNLQLGQLADHVFR